MAEEAGAGGAGEAGGAAANKTNRVWGAGAGAEAGAGGARVSGGEGGRLNCRLNYPFFQSPMCG